MNLILIFPKEIRPDGRVKLSDPRAEHIRNVLRASPGKTLRVGLLNGPFGCGTVEEVSDRSVMLSCTWEDAVPARPAIDLLLAMPRPKVLKRLWAQFAALGVGRIILTNAEKVERFYFDTHVLDPQFYTARLIEGLQQARDTLLPEVKIVKQLKPFLEGERFPDIGKKLIADPSGTQTIFHSISGREAGAIVTAVTEREPHCLENGGELGPDIGKRVLLAVGPEGGWTPYELQLFEQNGYETVGMGKRILRTDTACIGLVSLLAECLNKQR